jgi:hypothetical protein
MQLRHRRHALALIVYLSFLAFIAATFADYGISWDEEFYRNAGELYLRHFFDMNALVEGLPVGHPQSHGGLVEGLIFATLAAVGGLSSYEALHLVKALYSSLVLLLIYLILCRLRPASIAPIGGILLVIFLPAWLGQIFDDHMDGSATLLYALEMALALPMLVLADLQRETMFRFVSRALTFGVVAAIAFSHRVPLLTVPAACLLVLLPQAKDREARIRWTLLAAGFSIAFVTTLYAVDPWVRVHGASGFLDKFLHSANPVASGSQLVRFEGSFLLANELPRSYLLQWMALSIPLATLALVATGTLRLSLSVFHPESPRERVRAAFLLLSLFAPPLVAVAVHAVVFDGWRHFLFLSAPIGVIGGLGLAWIAQRSSVRVSRFVALAFVAALVPIASAMARLHPYQYVYMNEIVGGLAGARGLYENDYWAKSYKEAAEWVRHEVGPDPSHGVAVYVCEPTLAAAYYFSENMRLAETLEGADYAICTFRAGRRHRAPRRPPDHAIEREGVALTGIWKLR